MKLCVLTGWNTLMVKLIEEARYRSSSMRTRPYEKLRRRCLYMHMTVAMVKPHNASTPVARPFQSHLPSNHQATLALHRISPPAMRWHRAADWHTRAGGRSAVVGTGQGDHQRHPPEPTRSSCRTCGGPCVKSCSKSSVVRRETARGIARRRPAAGGRAGGGK